jgi:cytochrome d ubiquinol oxidase subunit II
VVAIIASTKVMVVRAEQVFTAPARPAFYSDLSPVPPRGQVLTDLPSYGVTVQNGHFAGSVLDIFRPLPIISGIALLFGYAVLGAGWLKLKSSVSLQHFASRSLHVSAPAFAVFFGIACIYGVRIQPGVRAQWASHGIALACLVGLFAIAAGMLTALSGKSRPALPFVLGLLLFVVGIAGTALIVFPQIVPFSVSLWDAASPSTSQRLVMIGAACVTPVVIAYSAFAYWIFRGKTPENGWEA